MSSLRVALCGCNNPIKFAIHSIFSALSTRRGQATGDSIKMEIGRRQRKLDYSVGLIGGDVTGDNVHGGGGGGGDIIIQQMEWMQLRTTNTCYWIMRRGVNRIVNDRQNVAWPSTPTHR